MLAEADEGGTQVMSAQEKEASRQYQSSSQTASRIDAGHGEIEFGDYILEREIARGGMGVVYRAEQKRLKRKVAVKLIRSAMLADEHDIQRFQIEAEAAAGLDHPNIVPIYEIGEQDGQHYFSMKLVEGGTLRSRRAFLRANHREAAELMVKVARAVHAAHQRGILHRDLKPGNVLVDESGEPFVTDFGLAKQTENDSGLTLDDQVLGTPAYMAPEQVESSAEVTTAADVYGLGAVFYETLTGQPPFSAGNALETMRKVAEEEPERPRDVDPRIERDLETIVLKCLEKDP